MGALLSSIFSAVAIHFNVAQDISFWYAGGVAGAKWVSIQLMVPVALIGLCLAFTLARSITVLSLGDEVAKGLGQRTVAVKVLGTIVVLLLTGAELHTQRGNGDISFTIERMLEYIQENYTKPIPFQ